MTDDEPRVGDRVRAIPKVLSTYEGKVYFVNDRQLALEVDSPGYPACLGIRRDSYTIKIIKRAPVGPAADYVGTWRLDAANDDLYRKVDGNKWLNTFTGDESTDEDVESFPVVTVRTADLDEPVPAEKSPGLVVNVGDAEPDRFLVFRDQRGDVVAFRNGMWNNFTWRELHPSRFPLHEIDPSETPESLLKVHFGDPEPHHDMVFQCVHPSKTHFVYYVAGSARWTHKPNAIGATYAWKDLDEVFFPLTELPALRNVPRSQIGEM
jgi:hypothetical protein